MPKYFASPFLEFVSLYFRYEIKKTKGGPTTRSSPKLSNNFEDDIKLTITYIHNCKVSIRYFSEFASHSAASMSFLSSEIDPSKFF